MNSTPIQAERKETPPPPPPPTFGPADFLNALAPPEVGTPMRRKTGDEAGLPIATPADLQELEAEIADGETLWLSPVMQEGGVGFVSEFTPEVGVHDEWRSGPLIPTVVLARGDSLFRAWALAEATTDFAAVDAIAQGMGAARDADLIFPGCDGWELVHCDHAAAYTLEALAEVYAPPAEDLGMFFEARMATPFDPADPAYQQRMVISRGRGKNDKHWKREEMPVSFFLELLCRHPVYPTKDGPAFVGAELIGRQRVKTAVKACYAIGLDIDVGVPLAEIERSVAAFGCAAVVYTTHSHGKTETRFTKDTVLQKTKAEEIDLDVIRAFLKNEKRWVDSIIETVEYVRDEQDANGVQVIIKHDVLAKCRVVFPLLKPFYPGTVAKTHAEGMAMWTKLPVAAARALGLELALDRAALDPSRLFNFPRHAEGADFESMIFGGPLLDWQTLDLKNKSVTSFEAALLEEVSGGSSRAGKGRSQTTEGKALGRWSIKRAAGFQIADAIRDYCPERIRRPGTNKIDVECPFDEDHSDAGNPEDTGFFCVNAGDGPSEIFTAKCQHDSCQGRTNLDFLGKMLKDGWFDESVLEDPNYNAILEDDAPAPALITEARARATYETATSMLTDRSTSDAIEAVADLVEAAQLQSVDLARAVGAIADKTGLKVGVVKAALKEAEERARDAAAMNRSTSVTTGLPAWYSPPEGRGRIIVRRRGHQRWMCIGADEFTTLFSLDQGTRHPDRGDTGDCGLRIKFEDEYGSEKSITVEAGDFVGNKGAKGLKKLRNAGLCMSAKGQDWLTSYLSETQPRGELVYDRPGFRNGAYILPTGHVLLTDRMIGLSEDTRLKCARQAGTLEAWKEGAAFICNAEGAEALQAALFIGAIGPMVDLCGFDTPIYTFEGGSSAAKSSGQKLGAALYADPKLGEGVFIPSKGTLNALEACIERGSGCYVALDEDRQIEGGPGVLQDLVFMIQSGHGKRRRLPGGGEQRTSKWSTAVSMSGETGFGQKLQSAGVQRANGVSARVMAINFDDMPDFATKWSEVEKAMQNFGHAGPALVEAFASRGYIGEPHLLREQIETRQADLGGHLLPEGASPGLSRLRRRAALLPALIWTAAEEMRLAGLIPASFNCKSLAYTLWQNQLEGDVAPSDPIARSFEELRTQIVARLHKTIIEDLVFPDGDPRPRHHDAEGFIETLPADKLATVNTERMKAGKSGLPSGEVYIILAKHLHKLAGNHVVDRTLRKELVKHDLAIPAPGSSKNAIPWDGFPGRGRAPYIVLRRDMIDYVAASNDDKSGSTEDDEVVDN